jgi:hypothetical protein
MESLVFQRPRTVSPERQPPTMLAATLVAKTRIQTSKTVGAFETAEKNISCE